MTIYKLKDEYIELLNILLDCDEEEEQVIADTMEAVQGEIEEKLEAYKIIDVELESETNKLGIEIDRLQKQKERIDKNRARIKEAMVGIVSILPDQKCKSQHFSFSMVKNGGKIPLIFDETKTIPDEFLKIVKEANNEKIREALKNGELDFVKFGERGSHLSVR